MVMPNGDTIKGYFKNNKLNGSGEVVDLDQDSYQKGNFVNGKMFGKGMLIIY